jgi:hypothetical protein
MQCTENDFTYFGFKSEIWEQSPVNEGPIALELLVSKLHRNPCY